MSLAFRGLARARLKGFAMGCGEVSDFRIWQLSEGFRVLGLREDSLALVVWGLGVRV